MKNSLSYLLCLLLLPLVAGAQVTRHYQPNLVNCHLTWTGYAEVGTYAPSGTVLVRSGTATTTAGRFQAARLEVDMRTIQHAEKQLAEHLRGADFFQTAQYPTALFVLRRLGADGVAVGQITIRGVTKPAQFPATCTTLPTGELRIQGSALIDRTQFGVNYNSSQFFQNLGSYAIQNQFKLVFDLLLEPVPQP